MNHAVKKIQGINIELQPCPFCNDSPEWVVVPGEDFIMRCSSCHASTKVVRSTPEEAATDWNSNEIIDDYFTITEDTKIDEYLKQGIKKVLFSEYSNREPFPVITDGFLCSDVVIITDKTIINIEPEETHLLYDELYEYGQDCYIRLISKEGSEIYFKESRWKDNNLLSISLCCEGKTITISSYTEYDCLIVYEK